MKRKLLSERPCEHCGKLFKPRADLTKRELGRFCSKHCGNLGRRIIPNVSREILIQLYQKEKFTIQQIAKRLGYGWKPIYRKMKEFGINTKYGALRRTTTYESCYRSENLKERTFRHILVAEEKYGRRLKIGEIVHHIDGNRQNNNPKNLSVMTRVKHAKVHKQLDKIAYGLIRKGLITYTDKDGYIILENLAGDLDTK